MIRYNSNDINSLSIDTDGVLEYSEVKKYVLGQLVNAGCWVWLAYGKERLDNPKAPINLYIPIEWIKAEDSNLFEILLKLGAELKDNKVVISWGVYKDLYFRGYYNEPPKALVKWMLKLLDKKDYLIGVISGLNGWLAYDLDYKDFMTIFSKAYFNIMKESIFKDVSIEKSFKGYHIWFKIVDKDAIDGLEVASLPNEDGSKRELKRCGNQFVVVTPSEYIKDNKVIGHYELVTKNCNIWNTLKVKYDFILELERELRNEFNKKYNTNIEISNNLPETQHLTSPTTATTLEDNEDNKEIVKSKVEFGELHISTIQDKDRVDLPEDKIKEVAKKLNDALEGYFKQGYRWLWVITLGGFLIQFTNLSVLSIQKIFYYIGVWNNTEPKRLRQLLNKLPSVYKRITIRHKPIAYWELLKQSGVKPEVGERILKEFINIIKKDLKEYSTFIKETNPIELNEDIKKRLMVLQYQFQNNHTPELLFKQLGFSYKKYGYRYYFNKDCCLYQNNTGLWNIVDDKNKISLFAFAYFYKFHNEVFERFLKANKYHLFLNPSKEGLREEPEHKALKEFFKLDKITINLDRRYILPEDIEHILELSEGIHKIGLKAPTGAGKTTSLINYAKKNGKKLILLVPYTIQSKQLGEDHNITALYEDCKVRDDEILTSNIIVGTYDQMERIYNTLKDKEDFKNWLLVVDEYHNLSLQQFRYYNIKTLFDIMDEFGKVIYCSGTFEGVNVENAKIYELNTLNPKKGVYTIYPTGQGNEINLLIKLILRDRPKKALVFINNKDLIELVKEKLKNKVEVPIYTLTSENKTTSELFERITKESVLGEDGIYITTSVIADGINLLDEDIEYIYITKVKDLTTIRQYIARPRKGVKEIKHIIAVKNMDLDKILKYEDWINKNTNEAQQIIEILNKYFVEETEDKQKVWYVDISEQERYIDWNEVKRQYQLNKYRINADYWEHINLRILATPELLKQCISYLEGLRCRIKHIDDEEDDPIDVKDEDNKLTENEINTIAELVISKDAETLKEALNKRSVDRLIEDFGFSYETAEVIINHRKMVKRALEVKKWIDKGLVIKSPKEDKEDNKIPNIAPTTLTLEDKTELIKEFLSMENRTYGKVAKIIKIADNIIEYKKGNIDLNKVVGRSGLNLKITLKVINYIQEKLENKKGKIVKIDLYKVRDLIKEKIGIEYNRDTIEDFIKAICDYQRRYKNEPKKYVKVIDFKPEIKQALEYKEDTPIKKPEDIITERAEVGIPIPLMDVEEWLKEYGYNPEVEIEKLIDYGYIIVRGNKVIVI